MAEMRAEGDLGPLLSAVSRRWALGVSYHGAAYCGWQTQPVGATRLPAVQDVLTGALLSVSGEPGGIRDLRCAGRTDAGVHAIEQVVQFDTTIVRPASAWVRGCNARLARLAADAGRPDSIAVRWAVPVSDDFDARFSARARTYWYMLIDAPVAPPLLRQRAGWTHRRLDVGRMQEAALRLIGRHDFSSFRAAQCQAHSPVRTLESFTVRREGPLVLMAVTANAFLHHMVRNLVGCLVMVGDGRRPADWVSEVLEARQRSVAAPTFSAEGLYLTSVRYESQWQLPIVERPLQAAEFG